MILRYHTNAWIAGGQHGKFTEPQPLAADVGL